jgi:hypothetical protein
MSPVLIAIQNSISPVKNQVAKTITRQHLNSLLLMTGKMALPQSSSIKRQLRGLLRIRDFLY